MRPAASPPPVTVNSGELKRRNLLLLMNTLRSGGSMSRAQLADAVGLSVPSVHRLVGELISREWVSAAPDGRGPIRPGRPTMQFRLADRRAVIAGVDVGSETTRLVVGSLGGEVLATRHVPTGMLHVDLAGGLLREIRALRTHAVGAAPPVAAVGIGVASVVDDDGVLVRPWLATAWSGLPLRALVARRLSCAVTVAQDNHFAALAESSETGTAARAGSLVVLELGVGCGAGLVLHGELVTGAGGGLGRLMGWPCTAPRGMRSLGSTLGELLTAEGLLAQYRARRGVRRGLTDGAALLAVAQSGDQVAGRVLDWAGRELAATLRRIGWLLDPEVIVVGGGLGRALFDAGLVPVGEPLVPAGSVHVRTSVLGADAVMIGGLLAAGKHVPDWWAAQLPSA